MPNTPRLGLEYPTEYQGAWFEVFQRFANGLDTALYANREDRNLVLMGGGTVSWDAGTEQMSFTSDILIASPHTGYILTISTTNSPITIQSGQMLYVDLPRGATAAANVTPYTSNVIPNTNSAVMIAVRNGTILYFRNGRGFGSGDSGSLYSDPSGGGGGTINGWLRHQVTIQLDDDDWVGSGGSTDSAAAQSSLTSGFTEALFAPASVDVFYNNALCHYTSGTPSTINQWTWATGGTPAPAIQVGAGSLAGDIVTVKYPRG